MLMPLIVIGCVVFASMIVTFLLYLFSGLVNLPVSLVVLVLAAGGLMMLAGGLAAVSLWRTGDRKRQQ